MPQDKFSAVWVSHSSISDFLTCPRAYYLNNIYRNPQTGHKIVLISPPLALGQAVHQVLESLSVLPVKKRFSSSLLDKFERAWEKVSGKKGGFLDKNVEYKYKERGQQMLKKVRENPGPLARLSVKIKSELPYFWLSKEDHIILCGKIDWLEYLSDTDSVRIIDFKTGKTDEDGNSLQLPIYHLLAANCQKRGVAGVSYWYLEREAAPVPQPLPNLEESRQKVLKIAKEIKLARQLEHFKCPSKETGEIGCRACKPLERVLRGEGELVGVDNYRQDVYILPDSSQESESVIL